ncbi:baculoviral IAP repeat-containing protein 7-B-like [Ornithodoros turicata]|uniref:baculoviral IAP repeat-containing protein 7-B-like n=1 Tax=Ornithodoros turicata TaxID=34597 RepID=UPI0031397B7C
MDQDIAAAYDTLTPEQEELRNTYSDEVWSLSLAIQLSILGFRYEGQGRAVRCIHCNGRSVVPQTSGPQDVLLEHLRQHPVCSKPIGEVARQPDVREQQEIEEKIASARPFFENKGIPKETLDEAEARAKRKRSAASVVADFMHAVCQLQRTPETPGTSTELPPRLEEEQDEEMSDDQSERLCKICYQDNVSVAFVPCSHVACCVQCATVLSTCPICRTNVQGYMRIALQ